MSFGLNVWKSNGTTKIVGPTDSGGRCFVGIITRSPETPGTTTTYTYPNVSDGSYLRVYQCGAGAHTWYTGTSSGQATVTLVATNKAGSTYYTPSATTLFVFSVISNNPLFGLNMLTDSGQKSISNIFPAAEFLGKISMNPTPVSTTSVTGYTQYQFSSNNFYYGANRNKIILWNLPSTTQDVWFTGDSFFFPTASYFVVNCSIFVASGASYTLPEAFAFSVDNLQNSSNGFGLRMFDGSGTLMFDSGLDHMAITGFETTLSYPLTTGSVNTYTMSTFSGIQPVFLVPQYIREQWSRIGITTQSQGYQYTGVVQRNGTTLQSELIRTASWIEDFVITGSYAYGNSGSLTEVVVNGNLYGAINF